MVKTVVKAKKGKQAIKPKNFTLPGSYLACE